MQINRAHEKSLCVQAEWASDMKELGANCSNCVAAMRSHTSVLNR